MNEIRFSVIIPVYNTELYLKECLESVFSQTYPAYEIILYNDGSTDNSEKIILDYINVYKNIIYKKHENQGQGITRNKMLKIATGDYIVILDSDDMLESNTFELCKQKIKSDCPDFVNFEYKNLYEDGKIEYNFVNTKYSSKDILYGNNCAMLLTNFAYYTWMNIYKIEFLRENDITYGEGYIYEDNEFYVKACLCAKKISLIHSPLYTYRIHASATTRTSAKESKHYEGRIKALTKVIGLIYSQYASEEAKSYIINHAFRVFLYCYQAKTPQKYKKIYLRQFVDLISPLIFEKENLLNRGFKKLYNKNKFHNKKYFEILLYMKYLRFRSLGGKARNNIKKSLKEFKLKIDKKKHYMKKPLLKDTILFLGFDYDYIGNSKYLYEQMKILFPQYKYFFVTESKSVPKEERIMKNSNEYFYYLYCSKIIVIESYALGGIDKREGQIWIQTWHATTVKKLLFDTSEPYTNKKSSIQKITKYKTILNWDYFITDCEYIKTFYKSCYLLKDNQLKTTGYPRVKYLIDNKDNNILKEKIKEQLKIPFDKKTILYAPTWRDYNYGKDFENANYEYLLDLNLLSSLLGDNYTILFKDHNFIKQSDDMRGSYINVNNNETQDLILISDFIVTDYSSIVFDGIAIDIPFFIYANDEDIYKNARGVYEEIFNDLKNWEAMHEMDLCKKIKYYKNYGQYSYIKEKYTHQDTFSLANFIVELIEDQKKDK